ncbi:MAG: hypothetical protein P8N92_09170, partial [Burkholderiales bacterium]|nr:hypothetical protein [Burkholderiales bacterium]
MYPYRSLKPFAKTLATLVVFSLCLGCSAVSVLAPIDDKLGNGVVRFYEDGNYLKTRIYLKNLI